MTSISTQIAEALQKHNIDLLRLEAGTRRQIVSMFNDLGPKLTELIIKKAPQDMPTVAAYNKQTGLLVKSANKEINKAFNQIKFELDDTMVKLAGVEAEQVAEAMNGVLNVELVGNRLTAHQLKALAGKTLIEGAPSATWWAKQTKELQDAFKFQMQLGVLNRESIQQLVQRVRGTKANGFNDGIMKTSTRRAEALVRSSVMATANQARLELYKQNDDVIKGMQWLSTLDSRTTDICKALDGQAWFMDGRKMPGTVLAYQGPPPAHWNCRSTMVPVMRSWSDLAKNPNVRKKLKAVESKLPAGFRSSMDGKVSNKLNYEEWLKTKDKAFQIEVLGPTKHKLWEAGKLSFTDLVSQNHNPLTVTQLQEKIAKTSMKAAAAAKTGEAVKAAQLALAKEVGKLEAARGAEAVAARAAVAAAKKEADAAAKAAKEALKAANLNVAKEAGEAAALRSANKVKELAAQSQLDNPVGTHMKKAVAKVTKDPALAGASPSTLLTEAKKQAQIYQMNAGVSQFKSFALKGKTNMGGEKLAQWELLGDLDPKKQAKIAMEIASKNAVAGIPIDDAVWSVIYKNDIMAETLAAAKKLKAAAKPAVVSPTPSAATGAPDWKNLTQTGPQRGSNPGGLFVDETTGQKWYVKWPDNEEALRNEVLAGKLYEAMGIEVPSLHLIQRNGRPAIASRIVEGLEKGGGARLAKAAGAKDGFVADAWLANWDVVGLDFDNMLLAGNRAVRVDTGGALRFRAQGGLKGSAFGKDVPELDSLRDARMNNRSAAVFGDISQETLESGARRVVEITDDIIDDLVQRYGPKVKAEADELAATLKARRDYIAKKFGKAAAPPTPPAPVPNAAGRISAAEAKLVEDARANGYALASDADEIEDQQILAWVERTLAGDEVTASYLKVRGTAATMLDETVAKVAGVSRPAAAPAADNALFSEMQTAIKGIAHNANSGGVVRLKDIERVQSAIAEYEMVLRKLDGEALDSLKAHYEPWINALRKAIKNDVDGAYQWEAPTTSFLKQWVAPVVKPKAAPVETAEIVWEKSSGHFYRKTAERGYLQQTDDVIWRTSYHMETTIDGVKVRYWPGTNDIPFALRNRVEIEAPGTGVVPTEKVMKALERLGINTKRPTPLDAEELYLSQIAYHQRKTWTKAKAALKTKNQTKRVEKLKQIISDDLGTQVDQLDGYDPSGVFQAFGHGRKHRFRPDLELDPKWAQFQDDYVLHHNVTNGGLSQSLEYILDGGGQMAPTTDKLRRGIAPGGMSPTQDLETGGANYFFTRIKRKEYADRAGFVWDAKLLARLDSISYDGDKYGKVSGQFVQRNRKTGVSEWIAAARVTSNETIFKDSLSLFDNLKYINAGSERARVLKIFRDRGYTTWPDGRSLEEVIR